MAERPGRDRRRGAPVARPQRDHEPLRHPHNPYGTAKALTDDEVAHLHEAALLQLEQHGVRVLLPEARDLFAAAGARVDAETMMVRVGRDLARQLLSTVPSEFELRARNPEHTVRVGGDSVLFFPVGGPPYSSDRVRGRRPGTLSDYVDFTRMTQRCDVMHSVSATTEAQDVPLPERHLRTLYTGLTESDKPVHVSSRGRAAVADQLEMVRLAFGVDHDEFSASVHTWTNINTNSPWQLDIPMSLGIIDLARAGQMVIMTPFTLAGAMAPVTLAGALLLQHIEAVAAICLSQIARPGAPVVYGAFTSNVEMRSGSPSFGSPEAMRAAIASGQLARHLGVPWRSQAASSSPTDDAQGAYETMVSLMGALLGGANIVLHAAGWQEGGLVASYEKFVLDVEALEIVAEGLRPILVNDAELALDALAEVPPGGHFFGAQHTMTRFETAFHEPSVFTRHNSGQWTDAGGRDASDRATRVWQRWLDEFEAPPMDATTRESLDAFVARRVAEGGSPPES
ncbi:MAG: trimethylamine methyltransferase family protein [Ilumatobacteraceae bacterium]